jgi:hypothetical protein
LLASTGFPDRVAPDPAIVLIRRMSLQIAEASLRSSGRDPRSAAEMERALNDSIASLIASAARPLEGAAPENARAVIFRDRAELMACLARDWLEGRVYERWWWRALFANSGMVRTRMDLSGDPASLTANVWIEAPQYIPAALEHLAANRELIRFALNLNREDARAMLHSVAHCFALSGLQSILPGFEEKSISTAPMTESPWRRWVPEETQAVIGLEQQCLLGVGLTLLRSPAVARSTAFAQAISAWRRGSTDSKAEAAAGAKTFERGDVSLRPEESPRDVDEGAGISAMPGIPTIKDALPAESVIQVPSPVLIESDLTGEGPGIQTRPLSNEETLGDMIAEGALETLGIYELRIETEFGGVFYLINLAIFLGLYSDFTDPGRTGFLPAESEQTGFDLPLWDFVALAGRWLAGADIVSDPVWPLLARLSGRNVGGEPDEDFNPLDESLWAQLMDCAQSRLQSALGLDNADDASDLVCRHRAAVEVTATRVDVKLSLADLPIAIRLAGLDRDPGWVPAAGRYIAFHFD